MTLYGFFLNIQRHTFWDGPEILDVAKEEVEGLAPLPLEHTFFKFHWNVVLKKCVILMESWMGTQEITRAICLTRLAKTQMPGKTSSGKDEILLEVIASPSYSRLFHLAQEFDNTTIRVRVK